MLTLSGLCKSFGGRTLFEEAAFQVNRGERVGLVGPNGAGKSTLFQMLLGFTSPDSGTVVFERGTRIGHLPQESLPVGAETVLELATTTRLHSKGEAGVEDSAHDHPEDYQTIVRAKRILTGLSFRTRDFDRPAKELSGGWIMRAHLARLLVQEPDLLMLDEPTNHLDLESLIWLQDYLLHYPGAILSISHDREFLNRLVGSIVEIRSASLIRFRGNYDDFLEQREAFELQQMAAFKSQQREIDRLMRFVTRFRAKNTKAAQAQSKLKQIERMDKLSAPDADNQTIHFRFPQPERSGQKVITLKEIHHAYGATPVYQGMEFLIERGQRIVLVGPNGAGKSTLLKLLADVIQPQSGQRELGHKVKFGYFAQHRVEMLQADRTVLQEALDTPQRVTEEFIRTVLGCFLFKGDDVFKPVRVLSGGEKSRLALIKLLLDPPNLLLMDEPTTHLDMASIDALLYALDQYQGTLVFISHDVYFIRAMANRVVHVQGGVLTAYAGDYDYFVEKRASDLARAAQAEQGERHGSEAKASQRSLPKSKEDKRRESEERQLRSRRSKELKTRVHELEGKISELESKQAQLTHDLQDPKSHEAPGRSFEISQELTQLSQRLTRLHHDWETAATQLANWEQ